MGRKGGQDFGSYKLIINYLNVLYSSAALASSIIRGDDIYLNAATLEGLFFICLEYTNQLFCLETVCRALLSCKR